MSIMGISVVRAQGREGLFCSDSVVIPNIHNNLIVLMIRQPVLGECIKTCKTLSAPSLTCSMIRLKHIWGRESSKYNENYTLLIMQC